MVLDGMCVWDIVLSWDVRNCGMGGHAQVLGRVVEKPDFFTGPAKGHYPSR